MAELGDKIPISDKIKEIAKTISDRSHDAELAFRKAAAWMNDEHDHLWEVIKEAHPELLEKHHLSYNAKTQELTVIGFRRSGDET
jgi:hypothetical protein